MFEWSWFGHPDPLTARNESDFSNIISQHVQNHRMSRPFLLKHHL